MKYHHLLSLIVLLSANTAQAADEPSSEDGMPIHRTFGVGTAGGHRNHHGRAAHGVDP